MVLKMRVKRELKRRLIQLGVYLHERFTGFVNFPYVVPAYSTDALAWASGACDAYEADVLIREKWMKERGIVSTNLDSLCPVVNAGREDICSICMENIGKDDQVRLIKCMHLHHRACIEVWLAVSPKCPGRLWSNNE